VISGNAEQRQLMLLFEKNQKLKKLLSELVQDKAML